MSDVAEVAAPDTAVDDRGDDFMPTGPDADAVSTTDIKDEPEEKAEPEAKAGEKTEPEAKAEPEKKADKPIMVPKNRLDEALQRARDLEARVKSMEEARKVPEGQATPRDALEAAREAYEEALLDGDRGSIKAARTALSVAEDKYYDSKISNKAADVTVMSEAERVYYSAVDEIESTYNAFNPKHAEFSKPAMDYAGALMQGFVAGGMGTTEAMVEAASLTALRFGIAKNADAAPAEPEPETKLSGRAKTAMEKALDAANKQPPALSGRGHNTDAAGGAMTAADIAKMDMRQFDKLAKDNPEALARARGDIV